MQAIFSAQPLHSSARIGTSASGKVDLSFLAELPDELRQEVMKQTGVGRKEMLAYLATTHQDDATEDTVNEAENNSAEDVETEVTDIVWDPADEIEDDDAASISDGLSIDLEGGAEGDDGATAGAGVLCPVENCGARLLPFAMKAHAAFHALPP